MRDEITKFCVSWVTIHVMTNAIRSFIQAWNCHRIPGPEGGVPNILAAQNNHTTRLTHFMVPSLPHMVQHHEEDGSHLCRDATFGTDPLSRNYELRESEFISVYPDMDAVFHDVIHGQGQRSKCALSLSQ